MKTVIVIPTYNERKNIELLIPVLFRKMPEVFILVVDDNSPDGTAKSVIHLKKRYQNLSLLKREKKQGLGKAYTHAFKEVLKDSDVDVVIMMDADFSHDPDYLPLMLSKVKEGNVVIGSRYVKGGKTLGWALWRRVLSRGGNWYCRTITGMPIKDCTGGYNAISIQALRLIDLDAVTQSGYAFIMGLKHTLYISGAEFIEIPIIFKDRIDGVSKISNRIIKEGIIAPWKMYWRNRIS